MISSKYFLCNNIFRYLQRDWLETNENKRDSEIEKRQKGKEEESQNKIQSANKEKIRMYSHRQCKIINYVISHFKTP